MKRNLLFVLILLSASLAFAGGIMTNTNQSAAYTRILIRDASTGIDAVYFNPAGLTLMKQGFHLSLNSQTIWQDRKITSDYQYLNNGEFTGKVFAPVFPGVYAAYKAERFVISAGFNPVGGGGGAEYEKGLPSFELPVSDLVPGLNAQGIPVKSYSADIYFKGSSVFWGAQVGVSAMVTDEVSVYGGLRYVIASTSYTGHLKSIMLHADQPIFNGATEIAASDFFAGMQAQATAVATSFSQYPPAMVMPDAVAAQAGLPAGSTFGYGVAYFTQVAAQAGARKALLADQEADVTQKGKGITPVFGLNFNLLDSKLNIGFKYEAPTNLKVKNTSVAGKEVLVGFKSDGTPIYQFPDGATTYNDMPAMLSLGANYQLTSKFDVTAGFHYYWDKAQNYGKSNEAGVAINNSTIIDKNYYEAGLGLQYKLTKSFLLSAGYLRAQSGVSEAYQSDMSYSISSNSLAFGGAVNFGEKVQLNLGALYSVYEKGEKNFNHTLGKTSIPVKETYEKGNLLVGIGLDFSFGK